MTKSKIVSLFTVIALVFTMMVEPLAAYAADAGYLDLSPGDYYILDKESGKALAMTATKVVPDKFEEGKANQIWSIQKSGNGYKAVNKGANKALALPPIYFKTKLPVVFNVKTNGIICCNGSDGAQIKIDANTVTISPKGTSFVFKKAGVQLISSSQIKDLTAKVSTQTQQKDDYRCGGFCLAFLRRFYGSTDASYKNSVSSTGSATWASFGFDSIKPKNTKAKLRDLLDSGKPVIVRVTGKFTTGHYIVIYGYTMDGMWLAWDPLNGEFGRMDSALKRYKYNIGSSGVQLVYKR